ncbi:MAG: caspase family protein [Scytolyngbya sp. HA4215-MV1]|nr:caspase family protein [Scytolyngbya sp. HA4215-MV1]
MRLKRRAFLQRLGLALTVLEASQLGLSVLSDRYYRALAQPGQRKLALLVGINQYPGGTPLNGCITDVELQRELLIHRFGFRNADIVVLTDQQATRQNIETAFLTHLIEQAKANDVVVFHFSGYGGILEPNQAAPGRQTSLMPIDSEVDGATVVNGLLTSTLALMLRSLPTQQVITILDTSYVYTGTSLQGNLRLRSHPTLLLAAPSQEELALQTQLLSSLNLSPNQVDEWRRAGQIPGVVLTAAGGQTRGQGEPVTGEKAFEAQWDGFSAGLFTYALTQALWQSAPATSLQVNLNRASERISQLTNQEQQPVFGVQKSRDLFLPYALTLHPEQGADGVVTAIEEGDKTQTVQIWMAGLPAPILEQYEPNSILRVVPIGQPESTRLQVYAQDGLMLKARICCGSSNGEGRQVAAPLQVGHWVQEEIRVVPRNLHLNVALDNSLERIERVDATSAFSAIPHVSPVAAGEQPADYLFGKTYASEQVPTQVAALPTAAVQGLMSSSVSYGLFSLGRAPIASAVGAQGEAIKSAVRRLAPLLQTLLAAKLLSLTENEFSSRLGVSATLELIAPQKQTVMQRATHRSSAPTPDGAPLLEKGIASLPIGSQIQYRVKNFDDRPVYFLLLGRDGNGSMSFYPGAMSAIPADIDANLPLSDRIAPGEIRTFPQADSSWSLRGAAGFCTLQLICSTSPFTRTFALLEVNSFAAEGARVIDLSTNALEVVHAILQDLHQANQSPHPTTPSDSFMLDINTWVTLRFTYQVIA